MEATAELMRAVLLPRMVKVTVMELHCQFMMLTAASETPVEVDMSVLNIAGEKVPQSLLNVKVMGSLEVDKGPEIVDSSAQYVTPFEM
jgi:vacuolar-type H+-ATPase subunit D/Vma8